MKVLKNMMIILSFICLMLFTQEVFAKSVEVDYEVKNVYINSSIDFLGSMHITEIIVVEGSLNGYEFGIDYKNDVLKEWEPGKVDFANSSFYNARGYSISKVASFKVDEDKIGWNLMSHSYQAFEKKESAFKGDTGVYTLDETQDGANIRIYNPNESGYMVYLLDYYINQAVVLHNDVAELYWTFWPKDAEFVKNMEIQVTIPGESTADTFKFWAHGSLNGEIAGISEKKDENDNYLYKGVLAKVSDVQDGSSVEIRMTFDKNLVAFAESFLNNSEQDAMDGIIAVETERANEANLQRVYVKIIYYGTFVLAGLYIIGLIIVWSYIYKKYDKEYRVNFDMKYYREFTGNYAVEVVDYLMNKNVTPNAFSASIMNLIYKKNIVVEEFPDKKNDAKLILNNKDNISTSEEILIDLLFNKIGQNNSVTLKDIVKYSKKESTANIFVSKFETWKNDVISIAETEEFFENKTSPKAIGVAYFALGCLLCILISIFNSNMYALIIIIAILAVLLLIYSCSFKKWTVKGREHYLKWKAFKTFLNDFGNFSDKELPEIVLWEKYLVYATVFGLAKKVQKVMQVRLTEISPDAPISNYPSTLYRDIYIGDDINHCIDRAYSGSIATINAANARSSMSSGSGSGGGFSSGGGFAGGGGSRGGF